MIIELGIKYNHKTYVIVKKTNSVLATFTINAATPIKPINTPYKWNSLYKDDLFLYYNLSFSFNGFSFSFAFSKSVVGDPQQVVQSSVVNFAHYAYFGESVKRIKFLIIQLYVHCTFLSMCNAHIFLNVLITFFAQYLLIF